jgi:acylphosphatase
MYIDECFIRPLKNKHLRMKKRMYITVRGKVQGVGFRYSARYMAQYLHISGYVKNKYDGSVCIEAEGEEKDVMEYLSWCHKGPDHARITEVLTYEMDVKGDLYFEIE